MRKNWKEEEIEKLKIYRIYGGDYCAKLLNRSRGSVYKKCSYLGLKIENTRTKYSKDELVDIINKSYTMADVIRGLNKSDSSSMRKVIWRYIERYNIDVSHFETKEETYLRINRRKIPIEKILVKNSTYNQSSLKKRIIDENILKYECVECCNDGKWNSKKLSLQLDHKNGVNNDNRIENLRFLCPNCHSQTPTYAGKVIKTKVEKKKILNKENIRNSQIKQRKVERPDYETLIHDIKNIGFSATGRRYGVSDNAIRKWKIFYEKEN